MVTLNPLQWLQTGRRVEVDGVRFWFIALLAVPLALFVGYQALGGSSGTIGLLVIAGCLGYPLVLAVGLGFDRGRRHHRYLAGQVVISALVVGTVIMASWLAQRFGLPLPPHNLPPLALAVVFVAAAYPIAFLTIRGRQQATRITSLDWMLAALSLLTGTWLITQTGRYAVWIGGIDEFTGTDLIVALVYLSLTAELLRRSVGAGLSLVLNGLVGYLLLGHQLPGTFSHRQFGLAEFVEEMIISINGGLFGVPLQVAASYAFLFILFGKVLEVSGGGQFFFDLAATVAGRRQGGVAKPPWLLVVCLAPSLVVLPRM